MPSPASTPVPADLARRIASECLAMRLRRLQRVVGGMYDDALRPHGLTTAQLNLLVAIECLPEATPGAVCALLELEKSSLSRNLDRLVEHGWVARAPVAPGTPGADGRSQHLRLRRAGRLLLQRAYPAWSEAQRLAAQRLGREGLAGLQRAARALDSGR